MIPWALLILSLTSLGLTGWLIWYVRQENGVMREAFGSLAALTNERMDRMTEELWRAHEQEGRRLVNELDDREAARKAEEQAERERWPTGSFLPVGETEAKRERDIRRTSQRLTSMPTPSAAPSSSLGRPSSHENSPSAARRSGGTP